MRTQFTVQSPQPLTFVVEVETGVEEWRVLLYLREGTGFPITRVREESVCIGDKV